MNGEMGCEQVRELAPDLAIGIADGQERDAALRHAAACPDCRRLVSELSSVADDLLLLAPSHEPPPGFASRTLARMTPSAPQPSRRVARRALRRAGGGRPWVTRLAVAASVAAALALGAGAVYQGTSADRHLADSYRSVLAQGHGSFFAAAPLQSPTGTLGSVFGYQGQPSWLFATLNRPPAQPESFSVQLITRDGRHLSLGETVLGGTHTTWGAQIPVKLSQVSQLRFVAAGSPR
jgi:anti-sigma factor RsiW